MAWLRKPVPAWAFLVGILLAASLTAGLLIVPGLLIQRPDFALVPKSNNIIIYAFNCGGPPIPCHYNSTTLTVSPLMGFTGIVTLNAVASNPRIDLSVGTETPGDQHTLNLPTTISLGPATNLALGAGFETIGNYTITVMASSGPITHTLVVPVMVQNITVALSVASLTIARGSSATIQMDMTSVNGATPGNLTLTGNVRIGAPGIDPYSNVSFNPSSVVLQSGGNARTIMTVSVGQSATTGYRAVLVSVSGRYSFGLLILLTIT